MGYVSESTPTYSILRDEKSGRWIVGGGTALPTSLEFPPPEGALFNLAGVFYFYTSGTWTIYDPASGDQDFGDITASTITSALYEGNTFTAVGDEGTAEWSFTTRQHDFTFGGDGTLAEVGFLPAGSLILAVGTHILVTISGDSVARLDVGDGSDDDRFTATQLATITAGTKQVQLCADAARAQAAAGDLTASAFEADGTTPCDPSEGSFRVTLFLLMFTA